MSEPEKVGPTRCFLIGDGSSLIVARAHLWDEGQVGGVHGEILLWYSRESDPAQNAYGSDGLSIADIIQCDMAPSFANPAKESFSFWCKWDGCSHWDTPRDLSVHLCGPSSAFEMAQAMMCMHDIAKKAFGLNGVDDSPSGVPEWREVTP